MFRLEAAGGKPIQALVKVPTEMAKGLAEHLGQPMTFEGRLTGLDAFAGNIYVEEARVISPIAPSGGRQPQSEPSDDVSPPGSSG